MTWQVGDLAVCVVPGPCDCCGADLGFETEVFTVRAIHFDEELWLAFAGLGPHTSDSDSEWWAASDFRKVVSDKAEQCEPEFVTLLKRIKRTVPASTETASEWLLRIAPLARRLNLESKYDTRLTRKEGDR